MSRGDEDERLNSDEDIMMLMDDREGVQSDQSQEIRNEIEEKIMQDEEVLNIDEIQAEMRNISESEKKKKLQSKIE